MVKNSGTCVLPSWSSCSNSAVPRPTAEFEFEFEFELLLGLGVPFAGGERRLSEEAHLAPGEPCDHFVLRADLARFVEVLHGNPDLRQRGRDQLAPVALLRLAFATHQRHSHA